MDLRSMIPSIAAQEGVDPGLLGRLIDAESGGNVGAVSPAGARGPAQLMPATARELGVNIDDPADNVRGGARYLRQQMDRFGDPRLALAAYNAGPGAVARAGGVPNNGETPRYVSKVMGQPQGSDDIFGFSGGAGQPAASGSSDDIFAMKPTSVTQSDAAATTAPSSADMRTFAGAKSPAAQVGSDALDGLAAPFIKLGHDVADSYRKTTARLDAPPPSLGHAAADAVGDLGRTARNVGDVFGLLGAPLQAIVNPAAGALSRYGPTAYTRPSLDMVNGKPTIVPARPMSQPEAQQALAGDINTALSAAAPAMRAPVMGPAKPAPTAMSFDDVRAAKAAAYRAVDQAGVAFKQPAVQSLGQNISAMVEGEGGAAIYPKAAAMAQRIQDVASQGDMPLSMLDKLRAQVGEKLMTGSDAEARIGGLMRGQIDAFIDGANPSSVSAGNGVDAATLIGKARDLNTRYRKMEAVQDAVESAGLRAGSTNSGANINNASRQKLRPYIDPKSPQQIRNLTPDETKALTDVVKGTLGQNALRLAGNVRLNSPFMGAVLGGLAVPTKGASVAVGTAGIAAKAAADAMTAKKIDDLLALMAAGGKKGALPPGKIASLFALPRSSRALVGAPTVLAPLAQIPSARETASSR